MKRTTALFGAAAAVILVAAASWTISQEIGTPTEIDISETDIEAGKALYVKSCAVCHGVNLEGQPDWRSPSADGRLPAPPHDEQGHTWHHPDRVIFEYTKLGGKAALAIQGMEFDSGMPGFGQDLSDEQIWNILAYIKSTWPDRVRETQAERTDFDNQQRDN
jgi:mono/diheme cytochrome c family protein